MNLFLEILSIAFLSLPYIWEIRDDRVKDTNKTEDVYIRIGIAVVASIVVWIITDHSFLSSLFLSGAIHFLLFDYTIAAILGHSDWFTFLGTTSVIDRIKFWKNMSPWNRFFTRLMVFMIGLTLYIKL